MCWHKSEQRRLLSLQALAMQASLVLFSSADTTYSQALIGYAARAMICWQESQLSEGAGCCASQPPPCSCLQPAGCAGSPLLWAGAASEWHAWPWCLRRLFGTCETASPPCKGSGRSEGVGRHRAGAAGQLLSTPPGRPSRCPDEEQGCAAGKSLRQSRLNSMICTISCMQCKWQCE